MPKRPEIDRRSFAKTLESQPLAVIPFNSRLFGTAANNGQMVAELSANHRISKMFLEMARQLTGHGEEKKPGSPLLAPFREVANKIMGRRQTASAG